MERNASFLEYVSLYFEGLVKYILVCCCVFALYNFRFSLIPLFTRVITIKNDESLFNDSVNIASYINYCNSNFEYNKALDKWIMPDGYLGLFIP